MKPATLGKKYDKIAAWWHELHENGDYGLNQIEKALGFRTGGGQALDVGCGAGGRVVRALQQHNYSVTGVDVSSEMIRFATSNHPDETFINQDIVTWDANEQFDFVVAWDSIFHLPLDAQKPVVEKLCALLAVDGVLIYTFGNGVGEHTDEWRDDTFYYSSIGINENLRLVIEHGLTILHLELDQYPERHVCLIAQRQSKVTVPYKES